MPTRTRTTKSRTTELERDRELEALGLARPPAAPRPRSIGRWIVRLTGVGYMLHSEWDPAGGSVTR